MIRQIYELINIFSASMPYYFQVKKFQETKSSEGYSTLVSLLIITSSILKVFFWFGKYYHWSLLFQAILITLTHFWLVFEAVKYKNLKNNQLNLTEPKTINEHINFIEVVSKNEQEDIYKNFFQWNQIQLYAIFVVLYIFFLAALCENFGFNNWVFIEFLGLVNTCIEGSNAIPQVLEIYRTKNVNNISVVLILCWFFGDFIKLYYFIISNSPFQFILLGILQVSMNFVIVYYYIIYKNNKENNDLKKA